jgi:hypothetical protein
VNTRTRHKATIFQNPFLLEGVGRVLPAGTYDVITDEELIDGLSFPVYRRTATMIEVPMRAVSGASSETMTIDPAQLAKALERDALMTPVKITTLPGRAP